MRDVRAMRIYPLAGCESSADVNECGKHCRPSETMAMRRRNQDEQLIELSKQVTELQFKLSLALLKLENRPVQPLPPANDNYERAA